MIKKLLFIISVALVWQYVYRICNPAVEIPQLSEDEWWGPRDRIGRMDNKVRPFKVVFGEEMISDLRKRLTSRRALTPPLENIDHQYGMNSDYLQTVLDYWSKAYDFAERERLLNRYPQYKTGIQGLDIHFIRVKPEVKPGVKVVPILLLHGWPGSIREFYEAIPKLTTQRPGYDFVFEVIVPSLPGYGYSDAAVRPGLSSTHTAVVMRNLMRRLGHRQYVVQGGDWGAVVGHALALLYPDEVLGLHKNMNFVMNKGGLLKYLLGSLWPSAVVDEALAERMYPVSSFFAYILEEFGYMHLQATKPDTVGVGLTDSPAGLAAYILEKFITWTLPGSKTLPPSPTLDALLDNLMVYWTSNSITTSMRLYAETQNRSHRALGIDELPLTVPSWAMQARHELFYQPPSILKTTYKNLLNTTTLDFGGHFIAFENPQVYSDDVFRAVAAFRKWHSDKQKTEL